jgi:thiosulfate/3-mercaptopyruvate sulfurtransferase
VATGDGGSGMVLTGVVTLVDVSNLARRLAGADPPTVLDVRWRLGGPPGRAEYVAGHIPSAAFLDLDADVSGPPGGGGRHPLPDPAALQAVLRRSGVRQDRPTVAYDAGDGHAAARLWWTLRWAGHRDVSVLDGGFTAWTMAGQPVEAGEAVPPLGDVVVRPEHVPAADAKGAARLARDGVLLDVRIGPRYRGETEPIDAVSGHIPGAVNLPAANLSGPDGRLRSPSELRAAFEGAGVRAAAPVGAYCGSGVTAAYAVLALTIAGFPDAMLYVGSWSHWITDPLRPIATGGEP